MRPSLTFWLAIVVTALVACDNKHVKINQDRYDKLAGIKSALGMYQVDTGHYPKSLQDLVQKPNDEFKWHGPYFDSPKVPLDAWGHEFIYEFPGKHNPGSYDLMSAGPDGKEGTEDDIGNW